MPLYDYRCAECDRVVEVMHSIHGSGPETCETCGGAMRKLLSTPAIHFKGSGWAKKDAAAASAKKAKPKDGSSSATTSSTDKSGSDGAKESGSDKATSAGDGAKSSKVAASSSTSSKTD
ncbi:MAG: zinc ribbon domain-containing protein [Chloroflexota bacterium]|nr:zinc ribbon domain-containing protein [Chloroflexota bacterium]